jgi:Zn-finger nucleic acid-binding protein
MPHEAMSCPVCRVPLTMSERQGVEIDYCPQCRGVWLDRGELDKIIERVTQDMATRVAQAQPQPQPHHAPRPGRQDYDRDYDRDYRGGHRKRRKSFLEELFD